MTTIRLPWPPSANSLWRSVRGKVVRNEAYKSWWNAAGWELAAQRPMKHRGPIKLSVRLRSPTKQAYDADNRLKACLDLLTALHVIEADDNRIVKRITATPASPARGSRSRFTRGPGDGAVKKPGPRRIGGCRASRLLLTVGA
jgi:crossover junction endodeoxyribonuclease RusA